MDGIFCWLSFVQFWGKIFFCTSQISPKKCHQRSINKKTCHHHVTLHSKKTKSVILQPSKKHERFCLLKLFFEGQKKLRENIPNILPQAWPEIAVPPGRPPHRRQHLASLANAGVGMPQPFKKFTSKSQCFIFTHKTAHTLCKNC